MSTKKVTVNVYDMTCSSCERRIEMSIKKLNGIHNVKANYGNEEVVVEFDSNLCTLFKIKQTIKKLGYNTEKTNDNHFIGILIIGLAIILLGKSAQGIDMQSKLTNASYLVLFIVGIFTSLHCVGMCGGIMLSQTLSSENKSRWDSIKPSLLYNTGRVISYTILGGIIGAIGSVLSLSIMTKAALQILAGVFMVIMGLNMAGFGWFKKLNIRLPWSVKFSKSRSKSPFVVGLLNGLMPCGPLQTMQLFALGTGSVVKGAVSMFVFGLGTVPLMLTFGAISGLLSKGYANKILKFSGILVITLGLIMGNRGLALAGVSIKPMFSPKTNQEPPKNSTNNTSKTFIKNGVQEIQMTVNNRGYSPNVLYVQKGIPVKWIIEGQELTSCNNTITIPSLNIEKQLEYGENVIQFTPKNKDIYFSCWMGMISGVIKVVDNLDSVDTSKDASAIPPGESGAGSNNQDVSNESIYGNDLSQVPTERLIHKAQFTSKYQTVSFKGLKNELEPLIVVVKQGTNTKITFDLRASDNPEGKYLIVDGTSGEEVKSFEGKKDIIQVKINNSIVNSLAIIKDNSILGVIEVVDDVKNVDLEKIRQKYFKQ